MRQLSRDVPTLESRRRMGLVRNQVTENLYRVTIDNATISASTFDPSAIVRGERVSVVWHPERNFWEIEQIAEGVVIYVPSPIWHELASSPGTSAGDTGLWIGRTIPVQINSIAVESQNIQQSHRKSVHLPDGRIIHAHFNITTSSTVGNRLYHSPDNGETWAPGLGWGNATGILASDLIYNRWFEPESPNNWIHLFSKWDGISRNLEYNRYDIDAGTMLHTPHIVTGSGVGGGPWPTFFSVLTRSGRLYAWAEFAITNVRVLSTNDGLTWSTAAFADPSWSSVDHFGQGFPDWASTNDHDFCVITIDTPNLQTKRYSQASNTWANTTIAVLSGATTFEQFSATLNRANGHIYVAVQERSGTTTRIRTFDVYGASFTEMGIVDSTDPTDFLRAPAITIDHTSGRVTCFYLKDIALASLDSLQVVGRYSDDGMLTWTDLSPYIWSAREMDIRRVFIDPAPLARA